MTGFASLPVAESGPSNAHLAGQSKILGPSWLSMPSLTVGLLGVQVLWSVEMSYASPYLLQLGLSKSWMAMVFLAGPLSGLIVQPLIGVLSDGSTSRWGRRRPYMLGGAVLCLLAMLLLGYTRPIAGWFTRLGTDSNDALTIGFAVLSIYCIDFSINAVQAVDRALIVDTLHPAQQASGNAWAARMMGVGGIAGFFIGNIDIPHYLPFLGSQQLGALSAIAALLLLGTHALTAALVKEKVLLRGDPISRGGGGKKTGLKGEFLAMWRSVWTLPRVIRKIFIIQFFAWLGWFPVLFYTTVYVGDIYKRNSPPSVPRDAALDAEATRLGSRALLCNAVVCLAGNILLPFCISSKSSRPGLEQTRGGEKAGWKIHLATLWAISHLVFACCMGATFFVSTVWGATVLVAVTGMAWAVTQWAPFSLLGEAILSEPSSEHIAGSIIVADARHRMSGEGERERFLVVSADDEDEEHSDDDSDDDDEQKRGRLGVMGNSSAQLSMLDMHAAAGEEYQIHDHPEPSANDLSAKAGIILGLHNICIVIPQFLVTGLSSIIFAIFDPAKSVLHGKHPGSVAGNGTVVSTSTDMDSGPANLFLRAEEGGEAAGVDSVAIIFRVGGIAAAIAFVLSWRLARELKHR